MQMIEAVVRPAKIDAVKTALAKLGVLGMTAIEVKGYGRQQGHTERYRGARLEIGFVPKVALKICVTKEQVAQVLAAIVEVTHSGQVGDGKIFVYPIERVVRIRTGEVDESAI